MGEGSVGVGKGRGKREGFIPFPPRGKVSDRTKEGKQYKSSVIPESVYAVLPSESALFFCKTVDNKFHNC